MYYTVLSVILQYYKRNLKAIIPDRSKLVALAYERGWNFANILQTETISRYRKWREPAHIVCLTDPISHTRFLLFENLYEQGD